MTPNEFFYPRVALDFYQSMTTCGVPSPTAIHFSIDGRPEGASTWDAPRRCGAALQPLFFATFSTEERNYFGHVIPYLRASTLACTT
ncbi:hypothetical protein CK203_039413 [Vitis vinifera]|uniref:Uncharacterized protein n=1 Tax=Vitis vinifera TaxID=29760 RepID=A0A438I785_VITVI|nr:hypothetical protein CK203_039413 [Vitis vinifera]